MLTSAVVGLLVGTGPCAPRCSLCGARCAPPHLSAGGGWMLTAVRGGSDDSCGESEALPALVNPFAPPLWVGEPRELRLRSGEEYDALLSSVSEIQIPKTFPPVHLYMTRRAGA